MYVKANDRTRLFFSVGFLDLLYNLRVFVGLRFDFLIGNNFCRAYLSPRTLDLEESISRSRYGFLDQGIFFIGLYNLRLVLQRVFSVSLEFRTWKLFF